MSGAFDSFSGGGYNFSPVGGSPAFGTPSETKCCSDRVAAAVLSAGASTSSAIYSLSSKLEDKINKPCDKLDDCIDEIIDKIKAKVEKGAKTCEECKQMAADGLAGTLEYAVACANACEQNVECSPGDPTTEGKPCSGCGQETCCCNNGLCEPCEPPEEPGKPKPKFVGWCNPQTHVVAVTRQDQSPPGPGYIQIGLAETEQAAVEIADSYCRQTSGGESPPSGPGPLPPIAPFQTQLCDLYSYRSEPGIQKLFKVSGWDEVSAVSLNLIDGILAEFGVSTGTNSGPNGAIAATLKSPVVLAKAFGPVMSKMVGCPSETMNLAISNMATIGVMARQSGFDPAELMTPYRYGMNALCRQKHLDPDKAFAAFLAKGIDDKQLDTLWAINGYCPDDVEWYKQAAKSKPVPQQLALLRLREIIDKKSYDLGMRQLGYLEPETAENLYKLTEQLPTLSDILRFMVRDADDTSPDGPVNKFNLDAGFNEKYQKQLKDWSKKQGIPEQVARYAWRAHWGIPSPTQLFNFWHRLRKEPGYEKLEADIKTAMIQQDILPFWHKHFLAVSFLPMGRVDIRRAFNIGSLKESELPNLYAQLGYSDDVADKLTKFSVRLRDASITSHVAIRQWVKFLISGADCAARLSKDGFPDPVIQQGMRDASQAFLSSTLAAAFVRGDLRRSEFTDRLISHGVNQSTAGSIADSLALRITNNVALKDYIVGAIEEQEARQELARYGVDSSVISNMMTEADHTINQQFVLQCQRGIKSRYMLGEIDKNQASNELVRRGTVSGRAAKLVDWWDCEKGSYGKPVAAAKLCAWLSRGAITPVDFVNRLVRIGYEQFEANEMMNDCLIASNQKLLAQAKRDAKEQAAASQRQARIAKQVANESAKLQTQLIRAREKAVATRKNRDKILIKAGETISAKGGLDLADSLEFGKAQQKRLVQTYGMPIDESLQTLTLGVETWTGESLADLASTLDVLASLAANSELQDSELLV